MNRKVSERVSDRIYDNVGDWRLREPKSSEREKERVLED